MISRTRGFVLAAVALFCATIILHEQIADLLVMRGDGELASGHVHAARALYLHALYFHPRTTLASERLVFSDLEDASEASLHEGMRISAQALSVDPNNAALWTDRGLCASRLGDDHAEEAAFYRAGRLTNDAKLLYLAALAARRLGEDVDIRLYESHHAGGGKRA